MSAHEVLTNESSDNTEETEYAVDPPTRSFSLCRMRKFYFPEPAVFFIMMPACLLDTIITNFIELQYCKVVLNIHNETTCLNASAPHFDETQKFYSQFSMALSCIDKIIPCIFSFFLGPWSDTFGRKPLMLASSIGGFIRLALWTWGSSVESLHPYYFLTFSIPSALGGGTMMFNFASFCYICDFTPLHNRAARMGQLQAVIFSGVLIAIYASPRLIEIDYSLALGLSAVSMYICVVYTYVFLEESVVTPEHRRRTESRNPFQLKQLRSLYEACYVKQTTKIVLTLVLTILVVCLSNIQMYGEGDVFYMFLQHNLNWTLEDYTPLNGFSNMTNAVMAFCGTWFLSKFLVLPDWFSLAIATFIRLLGSMILMFVNQMWLVYNSRILTSAAGMFGTLVRAFLSRSVDPEDLGKVFSFLGSVEAITPLFGSLLYNSVYSSTMTTYPQAIFFLSGILCTTMLIILAFIVKVNVTPTASITGVPTVSSISE